MHEALVQLVVHAIQSKYVSEKAFYTEKLNISPQSWDRWKKGERGLKFENMQIISTLFTDYEWMLVQKIARQAGFSQIIFDPIQEYHYLKYEIAKTWLRHDLARIESTHTEENEEGSARMSNFVALRLIADYQMWGYSDIIEIRLPGVIRKQIGYDERKLLAYVSTETQKYKEE